MGKGRNNASTEAVIVAGHALRDGDKVRVYHGPSIGIRHSVVREVLSRSRVVVNYIHPHLDRIITRNMHASDIIEVIPSV